MHLVNVMIMDGALVLDWYLSDLSSCRPDKRSSKNYDRKLRSALVYELISFMLMAALDANPQP